MFFFAKLLLPFLLLTSSFAQAVTEEIESLPNHDCVALFLFADEHLAQKAETTDGLRAVLRLDEMIGPSTLAEYDALVERGRGEPRLNAYVKLFEGIDVVRLLDGWTEILPRVWALDRATERITGQYAWQAVEVRSRLRLRRKFIKASMVAVGVESLIMFAIIAGGGEPGLAKACIATVLGTGFGAAGVVGGGLVRDKVEKINLLIKWQRSLARYVPHLESKFGLSPYSDEIGRELVAIEPFEKHLRNVFSWEGKQYQMLLTYGRRMDESYSPFLIVGVRRLDSGL